jgi:hypothetical protein
MIGVDVVTEFFMVCNDGHFEAKPMQVHLCKCMAFLLYYMQKGYYIHGR